MWKTISGIALGIVVFGFASASRANAGTEVVRDYGGREINNYAAPPPPPPVYYVPPPAFGIAVYPGYRFFGPRFTVFHRFDGRRSHFRSHRHWR
jgi:hypothetical protein